MPAWPGTLPQGLLIDGYSEQGPNNLIRSENSIGPAKVRRKTTAGVKKVTGSMVLTAAELATFRTFYSTDIADGSLTFDFPAQSGGSTWLVRFTDPYDISPFGIDWRLSMKLEILP